jgi:hypothetical protein
MKIIKKILGICLILICIAVFTGGVYYLFHFHPQFIPGEPALDNAVVITASDPFQLLVVYPDGRKTGFDPASGKEFHGIPGSKYYFQAPENNGENGTYWLGLTGNPDNFILRVIGQTNQYYSFGIYVYRNNKDYNRTYWGKLTGSDTASYRIGFSSAADFPLEATLIK